MAYIECDLDHKVPSIYDTLDIESKNTLDMTYIKGYSFPLYSFLLQLNCYNQHIFLMQTT